jgi:uncharacterized protein (TIGR02270 family)
MADGMMAAFAGLPVHVVVSQHAEDVVHLCHVREGLTSAPHVSLRQLGMLDDRMAANLDGLALAGQAGLDVCIGSLQHLGVGSTFNVAVRALELKHMDLLRRLFALAEADQDAMRGLLHAFGWVSSQALKSVIRTLLMSGEPAPQVAGLFACVMHRVDPGSALAAALSAPDARLRTWALRVAGEAGRLDLRLPVQGACAAEDAPHRFWAARSALLLGDRSVVALGVLNAFAEGDDPWTDAAAELLLKAIDGDAARQHLRFWSERAKAPGPEGAMARRRLIRRCGVAGDPFFIPWLIGQMHDLAVSRLAGEAFSCITGADLAGLDLERKPPEDAGDGLHGGPSEDPDDPRVALDEDESLPWPDPERVQGWWQAHQARFPAGRRVFMGEVPGPAHAIKVLREAGQRQRIAAAQWLCLLVPGTKLFQTAAPAWRQTRWLDAMAA